jgi:hypothetical protein
MARQAIRPRTFDDFDDTIAEPEVDHGHLDAKAVLSYLEADLHDGPGFDRAARGIINGALYGALAWAVILGVGYLAFF